MSIKFSCPHCSKALNVKDALAGKKAQCPGCKQVLRIPVPQGTPGPDVEAMAAAAFADEEKQQAEQTVEKFEFTCPMCDEKIAVNVALCGKQAPCPECRRIIRVPLQKKAEAKDWRKVETRPGAGIRLDEAKGMEGTWGTASTSQVSRQSLVEANVIPTEKESLGWQGWAKRGSIAAVSIAVLAIGTFAVLRITRQSLQSKAYKQGIAYLDEKPPKLAAGHAALARQLAGDYLLKDNKLDEAKKQFDDARLQLKQIEGPAQTARDLAVVSLASDQVGMGGDKAEIDRKTRLPWDKVERELTQTATLLQSAAPDAKRTGVRSLARQLVARGAAEHAAALAGLFTEDFAEMLAIVGLELLHAKMNTQAESLAMTALQKLQAQVIPAAGKPTPPTMPAPPSLVALLYGIGQPGKARALAPEASAPADAKIAFQIGTIWGLGLENKVPAALAVSKDLPTSATRVLALTGLGEIAFDAGQKDEAKGIAEEAAKLVEAEKGKDVSGWTLWRLAVLANSAGAGESGQAVARVIADTALRQQALLSLLPPNAAPEQLETSLGTAADKNSVAYAQALSGACRQQAARGDASALQKTIPTWEPEKLRPFGYLGLALGLQEHNQ
jgi:hypothetical protein